MQGGAGLVKAYFHVRNGKSILTSTVCVEVLNTSYEEELSAPSLALLKFFHSQVSHFGQKFNCPGKCHGR